MARSLREVAHDLNNALLPVRAYGELALRKVDRGEDPREEIEQMLEAATRAGEIVDQLRAEARRAEDEPR
ncbi:MAG TPA: histidine kinase dimerization/phospho-acceptor domain-containing protein [Gaiellaceae bacterium]|nr:histidine kinase dimerization/phospho-acceptor domain-containing protein [Gaiellaceae bacterium]